MREIRAEGIAAGGVLAALAGQSPGFEIRPSSRAPLLKLSQPISLPSSDCSFPAFLPS
jgi:hypothetical protein